jgi:hypothetical protein
MTRRVTCHAVAGALLVAAVAAAPARADVVHLKNGGTIACNAIEERGADLVLHQGRGVIVVPRSEVARIDRSAPPAAPAPAAAPPPAAGADRSAIAASPTDAGEKALGERRYEEARRAFETALAGDPGDRRARRGLAAALLGLDQPARARTVVEQALLETPADADLLVLLGAALARQDRTAEAIAALEKAYALRPDPGLRERIGTLQRQHAVDHDYRRAEAARFVITYDGGATTPDLETEIVACLDGQFPELARLFDFVPKGSITVVVYPEKDFREATLAGAEVAGLYDGKVRLPAGGLRRLDGETRAVLAHELAHAFIAGKSAGGAPRWLHEGLAQWAEGRRSTAATETALAREYRDARGTSRWGSTFTYPSALSFVEYLRERNGQHALNQVLEEIGRGADTGRAFETVTRFSLTDLEAAWGDDLARRRLADR